MRKPCRAAVADDAAIVAGVTREEALDHEPERLESLTYVTHHDVGLDVDGIADLAIEDGGVRRRVPDYRDREGRVRLRDYRQADAVNADRAAL
ncbi:MAG TPA: hypothetical protein VK488_13060 [Gaiellaceae bacterium]|nr:hypothetical protein [Gaiellaceae bacterium]